jgi:cytosine permease
MAENRVTTTAPHEGVLARLDQLYEFERQPVTDDKLEPGAYFAGVYSGEHIAATEFVIGASFVSFGASAYDVLVGLVIGNLLAVLSWALVCAPIAYQTRLTLYWYLRKIAGPAVTVVFNLLNAILFCILAGAMFTVSASAVRIFFHIPPQTGWLPTDYRFVLVVLGVGAVVVALAILGFKRLAQFATVCSPWMVLMFIAGALVALPMLGPANSLANVWEIARTKIWTGTPAGGGQPLGFWHIVAFAWVCNLATHLGLSDMALFRFARRPWYGVYSAFGMYLGHYLAWICAGIMGAAAAALAKQSLTELDSGEVAYSALGAMGALCVVLAPRAE